LIRIFKMKKEYTEEEIKQVADALAQAEATMTRTCEDGETAVNGLIAQGFSEQDKIKEMYAQLDTYKDLIKLLQESLQLIKKDS